MNIEDELVNQSVVVFGAARGIGHAIAKSFIEVGCSVYGFDCVKIDGFAAAGFTDFACGDVTSLDDVESFAATIKQVDHVINCVGVGSGKVGFPFWNVAPQD